MRLFIANVTKQTQIVCYRLDFNNQGERNDNSRFQPARQQDIPPGRQVQIGDSNMHIRQIEDIVDQLKVYGLIGTVDVPRMGNMVHPYVFDIDKPVSAKVMEQVRDHNKFLQTAEGRERRKKAAIATNEIVADTVAAQFQEKGITEDPPTKTDVTFEQLEQSEAGESTIAEGYHVDSKAVDAPPPPPRKTRASKKAA